MNTVQKRRRGGRHAAKRKVSVSVIVCVLLLLVIALLVFVVIPAARGGGAEPEPEAGPSDFFDARAQSGNLPGRTQEEIQAELDKIVEEGMFNISIASIVTMEEGGEALVRIENIAANHHNMTVSITLDGDTEPIYESAGLAPGQYIEYAPFSRSLPAGEYNATALFTAYNTDDLSQAGQAAAKITIVVGS